LNEGVQEKHCRHESRSNCIQRAFVPFRYSEDGSYGFAGAVFVGAFVAGAGAAGAGAVGCGFLIEFASPTLGAVLVPGSA